MDYIRAIERQQIADIPRSRFGDNVKVHYRITEGDRTREQVFQGDVIRMSGAGAFTRPSPSARSTSASASSAPSASGPKIAKLEVVRHGDVHRAKLYYIRERVGKAARIREKR